MERRNRDDKMGGPVPQNQAQTRGPPGRPLPPPPPHSRGPPPPPPPRLEPVDREKTCPLLLRVFTKIGSHHNNEDFAVRGKEPKDEVQIYTWKDATLRELTDLVKEIAPEARRRNAKLSFAFVYPDRRGHFVVKTVGMTHSYGNGRNPDENKALNDFNFQIGDYLDVAVL
ncbi:PREDICTED: histone deacetylase complex subunit SAP18-like [Prunus mume]|uniref:Histone deacetylase complex subunit SAP18-like n=1 Tax=Prunus mume TaxID=102107 RepID=A0ABM0PF55_PRUMU|nr:PREDICTED: histone deacetylase complex subunit SAP18-like [Prunus mume]